ncbi:hypothetical protein [Mucilaginibacter polytrichastri]|uniref:Uncharacterized protein n=1 Tax=Mucilaginibacter polytrichastri TaxID=1302689 RepID=A0A1Q6A6E5_9SPHI|nr:hypothetical protein [Mucilaginibacter polytrichastri]OKS89562.1 hypothetical protein RG47T_5046 [Mucilaginibacter polytrichastri]SFS70149.1 hypothetical protein SAMN04487890_10352 [Mucilaginibacter polytrichastri]
MTKRLICLLFSSCLIAPNLHAQTVLRDSSTLITQAKEDANHFKLNRADLKQFRKHRDDYMLQFSPNRNPLSGPPNLFRTPVTPAGMSKVREGYKHIDYTSDYFKPNNVTTRDTALLRDSIYVKAFRDAAYQRTTARRTAGHYIAIFGGVAAGVALIIGFVIIANSMG